MMEDLNIAAWQPAGRLVFNGGTVAWTFRKMLPWNGCRRDIGLDFGHATTSRRWNQHRGFSGAFPHLSSRLAGADGRGHTGWHTSICQRLVAAF